MKKVSIYVLTFFTVLIAVSCNTNSEKEAVLAGGYSGPPYTVQLVEYVNEKLPYLHSYTHAIYNDKIIMMGGRTNGLHAIGYKFDQSNSNKTIYVVDTKNWTDPAGWHVYSLPYSNLNFQNNNVDTRHFMANNAEFFTKDSVLYIVGGLLGGIVPTQLNNPKDPQSGIKTLGGPASAGPITLPYFTAIDLPALINQVMNNHKQAMAANAIRQVLDINFAITGGEISLIDTTVYLVFGWNFYVSPGPAGPGDQYSHQIKAFTFTDTGSVLSVSPVTICKTCWDGKVGEDNSGNYRRRDGSLSAMIDPGDGSQALLYYAGVFKNGNNNFDSPVWIGKDAAAEQPFVIRSNVYTCMVVPAYSKANKTSYATLLGGMKNAEYNGGPITKPTELTATNAPVTALDLTGAFTNIPFSNQFTTIMIDSKHNFSQYLLPDSFPKTIQPVILPASPVDTLESATLPVNSVTYNGSESELIWTLKSDRLSNGVIDYDAFIKANPKGAVVGYLHGGILSALTNVFAAKSAHLSIASNRIFAVKIVPVEK
ncbi:MAG: hypothetical protein ABI675_27785 [Chitinophagaceae bacterium]